MINLNSLTPRQKALCSVAGLVLSSVLGALFVVFVFANGLLGYVGYAMIAFGVFSMLKVVYEIQLDKFENLDKLNKKG